LEDKDCGSKEKDLAESNNLSSEATPLVVHAMGVPTTFTNPYIENVL
jgi:hypothetical protein